MNLVGCLVGRLVGWLVGWLVSQLVERTFIFRILKTEKAYEQIDTLVTVYSSTLTATQTPVNTDSHPDTSTHWWIM